MNARVALCNRTEIKSSREQVHLHVVLAYSVFDVYRNGYARGRVCVYLLRNLVLRYIKTNLFSLCEGYLLTTVVILNLIKSHRKFYQQLLFHANRCTIFKAAIVSGISTQVANKQPYLNRSAADVGTQSSRNCIVSHHPVDGVFANCLNKLREPFVIRMKGTMPPLGTLDAYAPAPAEDVCDEGNSFAIILTIK
ncbi:hypothetical protein EVAR_94711_1 [Eumeta japonica]|uniref:Uncharacterized protein n=1 Tax=Eumeta variegata TaxID=151549 RepID=A0A4C1UVL3_EUMVA|nr:hypothetical protein EVAR_94711_1 [Eumeta japonica]